MNFNYDKQQCYNYSYIENVDVIFLKENCEGIALFYSEEVESFTIEEDAAIVITKIESLVSNYTGEDIKDEEADGKKLKYTFKKNSSGKYYVSEIEKNS